MRIASTLITLALSLYGCASSSANDPLEPVNRVFFNFNHTLDDRAALPAATYYKSAVPQSVRSGLHNFTSNLALPVTFANDILQGEVMRAGETASRLGVNTTLGFGGVTDPATGMGMPEHSEDFGQTLGSYGVPGGPYLTLPLLGAALPRDLVGRIFVDHFFNPLGYLSYHGKLYVSLAQSAIGLVDQRSRNIDSLRTIERTSVDYYASMRDLYLKRRDDEIHNRTPDESTSTQH